MKVVMRILPLLKLAGIVYPLDGLYQGRYHHRISPSKDIIVSADPSYIIPAAYIRLQRKQSLDTYYYRNKHGVLDRYKPFEFTKIPEKDTVICFKLFLDYHLFMLPESVEKRKAQYVIVSPYFTDDVIVTALDHFIESFQGKKTVLLYDEEVMVKRITVSNKSCKMPSLKASKQSIVPAMDRLCDLLTKDDSFKVVFVLIDKPHFEKNQVDEVLRKWKPLLQVRKVCLQLVFLDRLVEELKDLEEIDTVSSTSRWVVASDIPQTLGNVSRLNCDSHLWSVEPTDRKTANGFVSAIHLPPVWKTLENAVLYKGTPHKHVFVNCIPHKLDVHATDWGISCEMILRLLNRFRNAHLSEAGIRAYGPTVELILGHLLDTISLNIVKNNGSNANLPTKMQKTDETSLKRCMMRIMTITKELNSLNHVNFSGELFDLFTKLKFSNKIMDRVSHTFILENVQEEMALDWRIKKQWREPSDALSYNDVLGIGIRMIRTGASQIEPWLSRITFVSPQPTHFANVYRGEAKKITDFVPTNSNSEMSKMVHAWTFTRHPYIFIPSQPDALLTITCVSAIESVLCSIRSKKIRKEVMDPQFFVEIQSMVSIGLHLAERVQKLRLPILSMHMDMSETNGILSPCMILGSLLKSHNKSFVQGTEFLEFSKKLFGRALIWNGKVYLKNVGMNPTNLIRQVLGLKPNLKVEQFVFDLERAVKGTKRFYFQRLTNSSPFAIVSVLGFAKCFHDNQTVDSITQKFQSYEISMKSFLQEHYPNVSSKVAQLCHFINAGQEVQIEISENGIHMCVEHHKSLIKKFQTMSKNRSAKVTRRIALRIEDGEKFIQFHSTIATLNHREVAEWNYSRPKEDQLELLPSGLLKHHCCYTTCPFYMHNFATEDGKKNGTRLGLMNHLQYNPLHGNYVKSFHLLGQHFKTWSKTYQQFCELMNTKFDTDQMYRNLERKEEYLRSIWNSTLG
jgi:hypothetical protein